MSSGNLPPQTIDDFRTALEELQKENMELRRKNEELTASLQGVEAQCEQCRQLFDYIPDAYIMSNVEGTIQTANRTALALFKVSGDPLEGKPLALFVQEEDRDAFSARLSRLPSSKQAQEWKVRLQSSEGTQFPASLVVTVATDTQGHVTLRWLIRDLTESRQAAKALKESEERYRMIFEHSPLGILHFDRTGTVVSCNKRILKILGTHKKKLIGFNMLQSLRDEAMRSAVVKALSGKIGYFEGDYVSVTGNKPSTLRAQYSRVTSDEGEFLGGVGIFEDITKRKQAEEARRALSRQRLEACNVMAHELRNALIKIGFVFPAINSVMSFLREQWELELYKTFPDLEDKNTILMRLGELILMGQPDLDGEKELVQLSEELLAEQVMVANLFFLPQHGKNWLDNKIRPKWRRLLTESKVWEKNGEEVEQLLGRLEKTIQIVEDQDLSQKMAHLPDDLRIEWPKLAYTEFSKANLNLLEDVLRILEHPALNIKHKLQLKKLLISLKALADITSIIEDRMNRMLLSLKSGDQLEGM